MAFSIRVILTILADWVSQIFGSFSHVEFIRGGRRISQHLDCPPSPRPGTRWNPPGAQLAPKNICFNARYDRTAMPSNPRSTHAHPAKLPVAIKICPRPSWSLLTKKSSILSTPTDALGPAEWTRPASCPVRSINWWGRAVERAGGGLSGGGQGEVERSVAVACECSG